MYNLGCPSLMRWICGILIMHCFVHLHGTFKVHYRRSWHFFPALPFHNLYEGVSHVSLSELEIAVAIAKQRILQIIHIKRVTLWNFC